MFLISFYISELASRIFRKQYLVKTKYKNSMPDSNIANEIISHGVFANCDSQEQEVENENLIYLQCCANLDDLTSRYQEVLKIYFDCLIRETDCSREEDPSRIKYFEKFITNFDELTVANYKLEDKIIIFLDEIVKRLKNCNYTVLLLPFEKNEVGNNNRPSGAITVNDPECCDAKIQNVFKTNKKKVMKLKRIVQRRARRKKCKSVDVKISPTHVKRVESGTSQAPTGLVKKIVESRFNLWVNEEYIENIVHPLSIDSEAKQFTVVLYVKYQSSTNGLNFIESVKRDLAVHLLESAFPEQTEVDYIEVKSITDYLNSWSNLQSVSPVFEHQRTELLAINAALTYCLTLNNKKVCIFTDSQAALLLLQQYKPSPYYFRTVHIFYTIKKMEALSSASCLLDIAANKKSFVIARGASIEVMETATQNIVSQMKSAGIVKQIKLSPDGKKVAWTTTAPSAGLYVYTVQNSRPLCHVESERIENGLAKVIWSPNALYLATIDGHMAFIDIYDAVDPDRAVVTLSGPLHDTLGKVLCDFTADSCYFATCERANFRCCVVLYSIEHDWLRVQEIDISDIIPGGICWCHDSASFLVWQSLPKYHLLHITLDGTREYTQDLSEGVICNVELSACSRLAAVQLDNGNIEIHDLLLRRQASELVHRVALQDPEECRNVFSVPNIEGMGNTDDESVFYVNCESEDNSVLISFQDSQVTVKYPRKDLKPKFSPCRKFLASYDPSFPTIVWIWVLLTQTVETAILLNRRPSQIHEMQWHSVETQLAITLEINRVLLWSSNCAVVVITNVVIPPLTAVLHFAIIESRTENILGQHVEDEESESTDDTSINGNEQIS